MGKLVLSMFKSNFVCSKRAQQVFSIVMLFVFMFLLFSSIIRIDNAEEMTVEVGSRQLILKEMYSKAESDLLLVDLATRNIFHNSLHLFALNGGFDSPTSSPCGSVSGTIGADSYNFWIKKVGNNPIFCHPSPSSLITIFNHTFIPPNNLFYDFYFSQNTFTGLTSDYLDYTSGSISYSVNPSFSVSSDFSSDYLNDLFSFAEGLWISCTDPVQLSGCITSNIPQTNSIWSYTLSNSIAKFEVISDFKIFHYSSHQGKFVLDPLTFHFAIDFSS
jgi:hypothetical protein